MKFFRTPFIVTIAFALLCSLSLWQLCRGLEKQTLLKTEAQHAQQSILRHNDLRLMAKNPLAYAHRMIKLTGHFQNDHNILLDNKIYEGQVGYEVITPFWISPTQSILINRGWIPRGPSRAILPTLEPILPESIITINGHITMASKNRFIKNTLENNQFPLRIQAIDFSLLQPLLNTQLVPFVVYLSTDSLFSFEALPEKAIWLNPEKHFAYALQWLLLAFSLAIIYTRVYYHKPS